jgi:site-specific DNA-methyltransferase (adenine-specific)
MDYMATLPDKAFELAIVDPPYGNKNYDAMHKVSSQSTRATERGIYKPFDNIKPKPEYFSELFRVSKNQIIWGGNYFNLAGGFICWNKHGTCFGEAELAYCSMQKQVNIFDFVWNGMIQSDMKNKEERFHPTQKPVALYKWLLSRYAKPGDRILDTHGGSGSICIACHDLGYDLTWMELDADYYKAACERYQNHIAQGNLFDPKELPKPVQGDLL